MTVPALLPVTEILPQGFARLGAARPVQIVRIEGMTIDEIVADAVRSGVDAGPRNEWPNRLVVTVDGVVVPAEMWSRVRPRVVDRRGVPVTVIVQRRYRSGSNNQFLGVLASIALIAATVAAPFAAPIVGATIFNAGLGLSVGAAGFIGNAAVVAALSASALAAQALSAPPAREARGLGRQKDPGQAAAEGNAIEAGAALPVAVGIDIKCFPPMVTEPLMEVVGDSQIIEVVYAMAGPHRLTDIRVDGAPASGVAGLAFEVREGIAGEPPLSLVTRYGHTDAPGAELVGHDIDPEAGTQDRLRTPLNPTASLPRPTVVTTTADPDQIWLTLAWDTGLVDGDNPSVDIGQPIRIRMRPRGAGDEAWVNLPEIHYTSRGVQRITRQVKILWATAPSSLPTPPTRKGWWVAFQSVPAQSVAPVMGGWTAHPWFAAGPGINAVRNIALYSDRVEVFLSEGIAARGQEWEIEATSGHAYRKSNLSVTTYGYGGANIYDLFGFFNDASPRIIYSQADLQDAVRLQQISSVYLDNPSPTGRLAVVAMRGVNVNVQRVSVRASRYVRDWGGTAFDAVTVTDNPAPHLYDVLAGDQIAELARVSPADIDVASFVEWRTWCAARGHRVAALMSGGSVADAVAVLTGCGYARLGRGGPLRVIIDRAKIGPLASPVQIFTPRNSARLRLSRTWPAPVSGYRVLFRDRSRDFAEREVIVSLRPLGDAPVLEQVTYDGVDNIGQARVRAEFDLLQLELRSFRATLSTDAEWLAARIGDLVGVAHDVLTEAHAAALIKDVVLNADGNAIAVEVDTPVPVTTEADVWANADIWSAGDVWSLGESTGVVLRLADGAIVTRGLTTPTSTATVLQFDAPLSPTETAALFSADGGVEPVLATVGRLGREMKRMILLEAAPGPDLTAELTLVDEAPALHSDEISNGRRFASGKTFESGKVFVGP